MATGNYVMDKGYNVAAALAKFRGVKFSAEETVTPVTAATDQIAGVTQVAVSAGEITKGKGASVRVMGATEWECSAAIAVGALVTMASDGRCKTGAAGERVVGMCVEPTSNAGERARVQLVIPGFLHP